MHSTIGRPFAASALVMFAVLASPAADWTQFRGPNATGVSADTTIPVRFSEGDGIAWKVRIPGSGNSSPVISKGKLFIQSASDDGRERLLLCLDAATGKTLWTQSVHGSKPGRLNKLNSLASATPAVDGERVYALSWDGTSTSLAAYDYHGLRLWAQDLGRFVSEHGAGTSPVVYEGRVFVNYDQDRVNAKTGEEIPGSKHGTAMLAFDASSGSPLWRAERKGHRACYSLPVVREKPEGGKELVAVSTTAVTGYDPATGSVNWNWDWPWPSGEQMLRTVATPTIWKDVIFAHAGEGSGNNRIVALRAGGRGVEPEVVWEKSRGPYSYVPCMLLSGDRLYAVQDKTGIAGCYDAATGKPIWTETLRRGEEFYASPVLIDGKVYMPNRHGDVYVFPASPQYRLLARNSLGEQVVASPAVADGRLYIRGESHLFCIAKEK